MNSSPNSDRTRLARELHDGLAQELAAIGYKLDSVIGRENLNQKSRSDLRSIRLAISGITDQVRNEIFELRHNTVETISDAINSQAHNLLTGKKISFQLNGHCEATSEHKYDLIRCVRELILNSIYHSNCRAIQIDLTNQSITYRDNGVFDETDLQSGFGLIGMNERLNLIGGQITRDGSTFTIKLP